MPLQIPCPQCGKLPPPPCSCPPLPPGPADPPPAAAAPAAAPAKKLRSETIKMRREKRGGGREIIILEGFPKGGFDLDALARDLKRRETAVGQRNLVCIEQDHGRAAGIVGDVLRGDDRDTGHAAATGTEVDELRPAQAERRSGRGMHQQSRTG